MTRDDPRTTIRPGWEFVIRAIVDRHSEEIPLQREIATFIAWVSAALLNVSYASII